MNEGWIQHLLVNLVTQTNHAAEKATRKLVGAVRAAGLTVGPAGSGWLRAPIQFCHPLGVKQLQTVIAQHYEQSECS